MKFQLFVQKVEISFACQAILTYSYTKMNLLTLFFSSSLITNINSHTFNSILTDNMAIFFISNDLHWI